MMVVLNDFTTLTLGIQIPKLKRYVGTGVFRGFSVPS